MPHWSTVMAVLPPLCNCSLGALDANAYAAFQASQDLNDVIRRCISRQPASATGATASAAG